MKQHEFNQLFPYADRLKFKQDYDGTMVFIDDNGIEEDLDSFVFWSGLDKVRYLNLPPLGWKWYREDPQNFLHQWKRRSAFLHRGITDLQPLQSRRWGPPEWNTSLRQKPQDIKLVSPKGLDFEKIRIYVDPYEYYVFSHRLPNFGNVDDINFKDPKNVYCLSLRAMYILLYLGGISQKNLDSDHPLASSLAHFYFYYHLMKFFNYRQGLDKYDTSPVEKMSWKLYNYDTHHVWYHSQIHYTKSELKRNDDDIIENIRHMGKYVYYDVRKVKRDLSQGYLRLVSKESDGLTRIGQVLFQESCQAYVYCILGAQAKTRWKIIGDGANSLQTQLVFEDLVKEVIQQNDLSRLVDSMRTAITATRVRLDFCISPGLELLPSSMVYIKDSPGYNNILLVSSIKQRFGVNNVNTQTLVSYVDVPEDNDDQDDDDDDDLVGYAPPHPKKPKVKPKPPPPSITPQNTPETTMTNSEIAITSVFLVFVGKLFWDSLK